MFYLKILLLKYILIIITKKQKKTFTINTLQFNSLSDPSVLSRKSTMVLTAAQTEAFFEGGTHTEIPNVTVVQIQHQGISSVDNMVEFYKDFIGQSAINLRRTGGRVNIFLLGEK